MKEFLGMTQSFVTELEQPEAKSKSRLQVFAEEMELPQGKENGRMT